MAPTPTGLSVAVVLRNLAGGAAQSLVLVRFGVCIIQFVGIDIPCVGLTQLYVPSGVM
jgi:hypothetical protein